MEKTKVKLEVMVDKDVLDRFRVYVVRKHGKLYGVLSDEIGKALSFYLETMDKEQ